MSIEPGMKVNVRTAFDDVVPRRAVTGLVRGMDFPVVFVCTEEEWAASVAEGRDPEGVPWPVEDVHPVPQAASA